MYNTIFHSPYVVSYMSSLRPFPPQTWEQTVFTPFFFTRNTTYKTLETPFQDLSFAAIYILLGLTALALILGAPKIQGAISSLQMRFAIFFALSFVIWEAYFEVYRYLATLELLAPVMLYILAQWIFTDERVRVAVVLGGFVCLALTSYPHFWQRVPWGDRYFQVDAPALSDPAHTLVIMNTQQPYAYVIPSFPQEVVFANIEGNWKYVGSKLYFSIEHQAVVTHSGPIYFMSPDADPKRANAALAPYNLVMAPDSCAVIAYKGTKPNSWPLPIYFCQVQQATAAQPAPGASQVTK
jgi:hypothetical protein